MTYSLGITLLIICPLIFLACLIDSIAGGGGIIALPAYMAAGLPVHTAYGTNKFVMAFGTSSASINYLRSGCVRLDLAPVGILGSIAGALIGTKLALIMSAHALELCLIIILPVVAVLMFFNRGFGNAPEQDIKISWKIAVPLSFLIAFILGIYDGFFGPGCGMFLILAFVYFEKLDMVHATGTTKVINWASNLSSAVAYAMAGKIEYKIAVPCILCAVAGNLAGSQIAIKKGSKFIKPVLAIVALMLLVKIVIQFVQDF